MRNFLFAFAFCGTLCLSGCFSLESAVSKTSGEEHVAIKNYGWSLFNYIPLCCGNANAQGRVSPWAFFRDDVTADKVQARFFKYANEKGRSAYNLSYHNYNTVMFYLLSIPIPYVITYKEIQLSGVLK